MSTEREREKLSQEPGVESPTELTVLTPDHVVARQVRRLRQRTGLGRSDLAEYMTDMGFDWKDLTVGAVERVERRLTFQELVGLSWAFGEPIVKLLDPEDLPAVRMIPGPREADNRVQADFVFPGDIPRRHLTGELAIKWNFGDREHPIRVVVRPEIQELRKRRAFRVDVQETDEPGMEDGK